MASPDRPAESIRTRRSVAVLGFRNPPAPDGRQLAVVAFSEMLNAELASDGALRMVPGEDNTGTNSVVGALRWQL